MVKVVVSRKKFGLFGEVEVLVKRLNKFGIPSVKLLYEDRFDFVRGDLIVVYHLSLRILPLLFFAKKSKAGILYVEHEPTSIKEKMLNNGVFYSISTYLIQLTVRLVSDKVVSPSLDIGFSKNDYVNLNYELDLLEVANSDYFLYLGRPDDTRGYNLVRNKDEVLCFPSEKESDKSDKKKREFLSATRAVLNVYDRRITQSGVTADALSKGRPVIVNNSDCLYLKRNFGGFLIGVPNIMSVFDNEFNLNLSVNNDFLCDFDEVYGDAAFSKTWLPILKKLKNEGFNS